MLICVYIDCICVFYLMFFFFKQKTAYEMRISDWSSDVCSSDLMVSSLTERNSEVTLRALELGAVDFVTKPKLGLRDGLMEYSLLIADKIRAAAHSRPRYAAPPATTAPRKQLTHVFSGTEKLEIGRAHV